MFGDQGGRLASRMIIELVVTERLRDLNMMVWVAHVRATRQAGRRG